MIQSIKIQNFQSHQNTILEFDKGINIIIGESDSGKTAVLRALRWVLENKPLGDSFRSKLGGDTRVEMKIDDTVIIRNRNDKENNYIINDSVFECTRDMENEIEKITNMSEINFQRQLVPHFLLSQSSGEVARYLNKIVDLDSIDIAMKNIDRKISERNHNLKLYENEIGQIHDQLISFEWVFMAISEFQELEKEYKKYLKLDEEIGELNTLLQELKELKSFNFDFNQGQKDIEELNGLFDKEEQLRIERTKLSVLIRFENELSQKMEKSLFDLSEIEKKLSLFDVCPVCGGKWN